MKKIIIRYEYDPSFNNKFWARSGSHTQSGSSWEEAKQRLLKLLKSLEQVPPDEEVEI
jgi:hypothetical protein